MLIQDNDGRYDNDHDKLDSSSQLSHTNSVIVSLEAPNSHFEGILNNMERDERESNRDQKEIL